MIVEISGGLGSGKTVLAERVATRLSSEGFAVRVVRVGGRPLADPATIPWATLFAARHRDLFRLVIRAAIRDAGSSRTRAALLWNIFRKAGMSERLARESCEEIVIWDEGTVHMAHNAFAHISCPPRTGEVLEFGRLVPMPDLLVRVQASSAVALRRVRARGHKRTGGNPSAISALLANADRVFDLLTQVESVSARTVKINNDSDDLADLAPEAESIAKLILDRGLVSQ
jgi:thymidylate kinase